MKKEWTRGVAAALVLLTLSGCANPPKQTEKPGIVTEAATVPEETVPATVPQNGNPEDVTCKGSYTGQGDASAVVATLDGASLTNGVLNAYYWAAVADYREQAQNEGPNFDRPLDTQVCAIDASVRTWQQYFLRQALNRWHSAQALKLQGDAQGLPAEEAYQPNLKNHAKYLVDIPAMRYHYSYNLETFHPNTLHQAYLDTLPEHLETLAQERGYSDASAMAREAFGTTLEDLRESAELYNRGYMYFTNLSYYAEATQEELDAYCQENLYAYTQEGKTIDLRHILVVPEDLVEEDDTPAWKKQTETTAPVVLETVTVAEDGRVTCSEAAWAAGLAKAEELLKTWSSASKPTEATFAELARYHSDDPGSAINGGSYRDIRQGQLLEPLDKWCFDDARQPGDTTIVRSDYGYHILYFAGATTTARAQARQDLTLQRQRALIETAREQYPMEVRYDAITLSEAEAAVSGSDLLYPDIAHQRYPEAPLYLQQDYPSTMYGGFPIRTNGCGITTMSMLASYMTDQELTPPEMCARYGNYSFKNGTDGRIFQLESPVLGFYCKEKTYDPPTAKKALEEGYLVVSLQHKGYWTRGGHYLLVEKMNEDGTVQVRDSNIFNYGKLEGHYEDRFKWSLIPAYGSAFWIFEKKVTAIPACARCGDPEGVVQSLLKEDYLCEKCAPALLRRNTYQTVCAEG